jgi:AraC-like DNA-binding protein
VAGAEGLMLPVQRFEMITDDLDLSATIGHLYARHRPRVRRIARTRVNGGLRAAAAGPLNAGLVRMVGFEYEAQADRVHWLLTAVISTGTVAVTAGREQAAVARGGALLFPLGAQFAVVGRSAAAGDTVAAIARRWGFSRPGRFAAVYQAAYGRPPSHTLLR